MENKPLLIVRDIVKAFLAGTCLALILTLVLFGIGMLAGNHGISSGLETAKDGVLILAAAGMFIIAGMLLIKGKKLEKTASGNGWKKHFHIMGYKGVIGTICAAFLIIAEIVDRILLTNYIL